MLTWRAWLNGAIGFTGRKPKCRKFHVQPRRYFYVLRQHSIETNNNLSHTLTSKDRLFIMGDNGTPADGVAQGLVS